MNDMQLVKSANFGVVKCDFYSDRDNREIWMTREQIGRALEYSNPQKAIDNLHIRNKDRLDKFSVTLKLRATDGKLYDTKLYSAKGVYEICRYSRQPKADMFMDWVWDIVESIRKHGAYMTQETIEKALTSPDFLIQLATKLKEEQEARKALEKQMEKDKPFTNFAKSIANSSDAITFGEFAKILNNNRIKMGRNRLFEWMRKNGYLIRHGRERNKPKQQYIEQGLFQVKESVIHTIDKDLVRTTTLITGKGQLHFLEKLKEEQEQTKEVTV